MLINFLILEHDKKKECAFQDFIYALVNLMLRFSAACKVLIGFIAVASNSYVMVHDSLTGNQVSLVRGSLIYQPTSNF